MWGSRSTNSPREEPSLFRAQPTIFADNTLKPRAKPTYLIRWKLWRWFCEGKPNLLALIDVLLEQLHVAGVAVADTTGWWLFKAFLLFPAELCCSRRGCWLGSAWHLQEPIAWRLPASPGEPGAGRSRSWGDGGVASHSHGSIWGAEKKRKKTNTNNTEISSK